MAHNRKMKAMATDYPMRNYRFWLSDEEYEEFKSIQTRVGQIEKEQRRLSKVIDRMRARAGARRRNGLR